MIFFLSTFLCSIQVTSLGHFGILITLRDRVTRAQHALSSISNFFNAWMTFFLCVLKGKGKMSCKIYVEQREKDNRQVQSLIDVIDGSNYIYPWIRILCFCFDTNFSSGLWSQTTGAESKRAVIQLIYCLQSEILKIKFFNLKKIPSTVPLADLRGKRGN